ncbi:hypothetical protein LUX33_23665 [Actinomadura madurae]|uniref:hypothetical protein n=1 Tax=Actinomadura madurae TaxID=1993 RepID=UPI0020D23544|nr:hypothetical protein [Actinomadura madurae]MCP9951115.1 hypothetical protein [Actinomadura madurae]
MQGPRPQVPGGEVGRGPQQPFAARAVQQDLGAGFRGDDGRAAAEPRDQLEPGPVLAPLRLGPPAGDGRDRQVAAAQAEMLQQPLRQVPGAAPQVVGVVDRHGEQRAARPAAHPGRPVHQRGRLQVTGQGHRHRLAVADDPFEDALEPLRELGGRGPARRARRREPHAGRVRPRRLREQAAVQGLRGEAGRQPGDRERAARRRAGR